MLHYYITFAGHHTKLQRGGDSEATMSTATHHIELVHRGERGGGMEATLHIATLLHFTGVRGVLLELHLNCTGVKEREEATLHIAHCYIATVH